MKRKTSERESLARGMAQMGLMDSPSLRFFLMGEEVEIWRRECSCEKDCGCWEFAGRRPATDADRAAFAIAQRPDPPKQTPSPLAENDNAVAEVAARIEADAGRRWRPLFGEDRR